MAGWLALGGVAAAYDVWALRFKQETLSTAAGRHPWVVGLAALGLIAHFNSHRFPIRRKR